MNTQLEPPPVPPLTTSQRARLRNQVMDGAAPPSVRRSHRWTVPAISVAATALVVAGALVIGNQVPDPGSGNPPVGGSVSTNTGAPTGDPPAPRKSQR